MNIWGLWVAHPWALGQVYRCRHMFPPERGALNPIRRQTVTRPPQHHCTCLAVLVIVGVQMLGGTIDGFPPSSLHQTSWSRESQPAKRKNQLGFSVIQVCSIFRKQDLTITFWRMTKINSLCCFRVLPGYSWLEKQQKQKNLREISHTCHWGFCKPKVSGTSIVLCVRQP